MTLTIESVIGDGREFPRRMLTMPLDATPQTRESVRKTHSPFDDALRRADWFWGRLRLRNVRSHAGLRCFIAALGLLVREARRDRVTADRLCKERGANGVRLEVRITRLVATGPYDPDKQDQTARWASAAAYIARPPNGDPPPATWKEAVRYAERRGITKLARLYASGSTASADDDDIDLAFIPRDLAGFSAHPGKILHAHWCTPRAIFIAMRVMFDLDPASPGAALVPHIPVGHHFTIADDGLAQRWFGAIWCNPPYGRHSMPKWVAKFLDHIDHGGSGVMLTSERSSTRWYQRLAARADLILMLNRKLKFENGSSTKRQFPCGTHLFGFGAIGIEALTNAHRAGLGLLVRPIHPAA
jgi:hypothetical protein